MDKVQREETAASKMRESCKKKPRRNLCSTGRKSCRFFLHVGRVLEKMRPKNCSNQLRFKKFVFFCLILCLYESFYSVPSQVPNGCQMSKTLIGEEKVSFHLCDSAVLWILDAQFGLCLLSILAKRP